MSGGPWPEPAPQPDPAEYDVIIIGSGGGGLAAGSLLAQAGKRVLVLEQHTKLGGYMTNFRRKDYLFEASLHAIDGLREGAFNRSLLQKLGVLDRVRPVRLAPVMYRAIYSDRTLDIPAEVASYQAMLSKAFPAEAPGLERLFKTMVDLQLVLENFTGNPATLLKFMARHPLKTARFLACSFKTLSQLLSGYLTDPKLISVFCELADFTGSAPDRLSALYFAAMWGSYHVDGFYYLQGTSRTMADGLAQVIREHGGTLLTGQMVDRIQVEQGLVTAVGTAGGAEYRCRYVVANCNPQAAFFHMIEAKWVPEKYRRKLETLTVGPSVFVVYLGVAATFAEAFPNGVHELAVNATYDPREKFRCHRLAELDQACLLITNYSILDPEAAPAGKSVICLSALVAFEPDLAQDRVEDRARYRERKEAAAQVLIRRAEALLPGLSSHLEVLEVGTPVTMQRYTGNPKGSFVGWENTPGQSALARLPQRTPIKNLLLAGAWTFPGAGQICVLISGLIAAELILKD